MMVSSESFARTSRASSSVPPLRISSHMFSDESPAESMPGTVLSNRDPMSGVVTGELDSEKPLTAAMDSVISVAAVISARVGAAGLARGRG
jgi:hypothetical protein